MAALEADSRRSGTVGGELDFALLLDGLSAEREQGITIDVSYRYFSTARRHFIVADTPGHEQYTRNMVTGASTADCAVILLDARKGVLDPDAAPLVARRAARHPPRRARGQQDGPRRVRRGALPRDRGRVRARRAADRAARRPMHPGVGARRATTSSRPATTRPGTTGRRCSATSRTSRSTSSAWRPRRFGMPVQLVVPAELGLPRLRRARSPAAPAARRRDPRAPARARAATVARIVTYDGDLEEAVAGQAVTLTLADEIDASRGDMIAAADDPPGRGRPVRGDRRVDGRRPDVPRPQLPDAGRLPARHRDGRAAQVQAQRQLARTRGGDEARAQRDRRRRPRARPRRRLRPLRGQPRHRRLHPRSTGSPTRPSARG